MKHGAIISKIYIHFNTKSVKKSDKMPRKKDANKPPSAKIVFDGELETKFEAVKRHYGVKNNTDLLRLLITMKYDELKKAGEI